MNLNIYKCPSTVKNGFQNSNYDDLIQEPIHNNNQPKGFSKLFKNGRVRFTDNKIISMNKNYTLIQHENKIKYIAKIEMKKSDDIEYRGEIYNYIYIFKKVYIIPDNYALFDGFNKDNLILDVGQGMHCEINTKNKITDNNKKYLELYNDYILGLLPTFKCIEYKIDDEKQNIKKDPEYIGYFKNMFPKKIKKIESKKDVTVGDIITCKVKKKNIYCKVTKINERSMNVSDLSLIINNSIIYLKIGELNKTHNGNLNYSRCIHLCCKNDYVLY